MLERGVYLPPAQFAVAFVSLAHTEADIDVFASDWGNGTTVDTYVVELPSYGSAATLSVGDVTVTEGSGGTRQATFTVTLVN